MVGANLLSGSGNYRVVAPPHTAHLIQVRQSHVRFGQLPPGVATFFHIHRPLCLGYNVYTPNSRPTLCRGVVDLRLTLRRSYVWRSVQQPGTRLVCPLLFVHMEVIFQRVWVVVYRLKSMCMKKGDQDIIAMSLLCTHVMKRTVNQDWNSAGLFTPHFKMVVYS